MAPIKTSKPGNEAKAIVLIYHEREVLEGGKIVYTPLHCAEAAEEVDTGKAAKIAGLSMRRIQELCDQGFYKTARKRGANPKSPWMISLREVLMNKQERPVG